MDLCLTKFVQMTILDRACIRPITFGCGICYITDMCLTKFVQIMILDLACIGPITVGLGILH